MWIIARRMTLTADPVDVFADLFAADDHSWLLDSALTGDQARFSFLGSAAGPLARIARVRHGHPGVQLRDRTGTHHVDRDLLDVIADDLAHIGDPATDEDLPFGFRLGWVGYLGYEYGMRLLTDLDVPDETPEAALVFTDRSVVLDTIAGCAWVLALTDDRHEAAQRSWLQSTMARLSAMPKTTGAGENATGVEPPVPAQAITVRHSRASYLELIRRCQEHIAAGDSYELCLTNRVHVAVRTDPWLLYRRLRDTSPRPFGAYLAFDGGRVLSASPERFLSISADGAVEAKPIKGTRPRGDTPEEDQRLAEELRTDEKELAENLMIVDLLRNDLNRVCEPGSVHVPTLFDVETYPGVHQLVSTVRGRLRPGLTAVDAVRSAFPGGSMTGAPKHRSVQLLRELEDGPRGVYSGVVGYFSLNGVADWSIVIRTVVWHPDHLTYGIGGAITADSTAEAEWHETVVKARTLGTALDLDLDVVLPVARATAATVPATPAELAPGSYRWRDGRFESMAELTAPLLVVDSWRQVDGRVQWLPAHRQRFVNSAPIDPALASRFFDQAAAAVPGLGEWMPRVRLLGTAEQPQLVLDVRPGPPRNETARVLVLPSGDERRNPRIKGPDLAWAGDRIAAARSVGADEVLVRDDEGRVLEAGWAALVWWDDDTLVLPDAGLPILPSITRRRLVELARRRGVPVREDAVGIDALAGREAWLLNAYQGLRLVTDWMGVDLATGPGTRFATWRRLLDDDASDPA